MNQMVKNTHQKGVIAAGNRHTAQAGADILTAGGNGVDAAIGAAFASFVAEGALVNFCGGGIAQVVDPESGQTVTYDFFSNMPGLGRQESDKNRPLNFHKITVDFGSTTQDFHIGRGSVAVPSNLFGLCAMHRDFGHMPFKEVVQPAIELARSGAKLDEFQALCCSLLTPICTNNQSMREIFEPNGKYVAAGDRVFIPDLAETLEEIAAEGERPLRFGRLAKAIVADQEEHGGLLTRQDLASYNVIRSQPIQVPYRGYDVLLPRPASTGGVLTAFTLKLLSRFDLSKFTHGSADHLQILAEAMSATSRARPSWEESRRQLRVDEAVERFLSDEFTDDFVAEAMSAIAHGRSSNIEDEMLSHNDTSHISAVDANGMAVAITTSSGESAGFVVPGTGLIPNNMLGEEDLFPDGFHNYPTGERIYTMMTPTIVLKDGQPRLVTGSGGSIRIRSAIMQIISNVLDFDMSLDAATAHPRVHMEHKVLQCEGGTDSAAMDKLTSMGYKLNRWSTGSMYFGGAHSIQIGADQAAEGCGDPRRAGVSRSG